MNTFKFTLQNATYIPHRKMYDEANSEKIETILNLPEWNHYIFAKVPLVRFVNLAQTEVTKDRIAFFYKYKNEIKLVKTNLLELSKSFGFGISKKIIEENEFEIEEKKDESNNTELAFLIKFKDRSTRVIYHTIELLDTYLNIKPEILYIGESKRIKDRMNTHHSLHKILSTKDDNEDIRIYFLYFETAAGGSIGNSNLSNLSFDLILANSKRNIELQKPKMRLVERLLIYFFQPEINDKHRGTLPEDDNLVKELLINNNIDRFILDMGTFHPTTFQFWSKNQFLDESLVTYIFNRDNEFKSGIVKK